MRLVELPKTPNPRSEELVGFLQELLAKAESGEVLGCVVVSREPRDCSYNIVGFIGGFSSIGALEKAKHHLLELEFADSGI